MKGSGRRRWESLLLANTSAMVVQNLRNNWDDKFLALSEQAVSREMRALHHAKIEAGNSE